MKTWFAKTALKIAIKVWLIKSTSSIKYQDQFKLMLRVEECWTKNVANEFSKVESTYLTFYINHLNYLTWFLLFQFVIDTSGVGAGTLSITVDGPSKVDLSCNEVDDGYEVTYTPMAPGKYYVTVKYNGKNVRGSPFSVMINGDNLTSSTTINTNNNNRAINTNR